MEAMEAIESLSELDQPLGRPFAGKRRLANIVDVRMPGTHYRSSVEAGDLPVRPGELLIIENERGIFAAQAEGYAERRLIPAQDNRRALRIATEQDRADHAEQPGLTREGLRRAVMLARSKRVDIKFVTLDYTHDRSRVYVFYANDERIDLRHFARDLANTLNSRVELRQVGLREGAGMVGGIGPCGNDLCCSSFLRSFESISMKYAKQQGLAIHQQRITGMCGRLKCCLIYEADAYKELKRYAPKNGTGVLTPQGPGELKEFDLISQRGRVRLAGEGSAWFAVADLVLLGRQLTAEEIAAGTSREMQVLNRRRASRGLGSGTSDGAGGERSRAADVEGYLWSDTANAGAEEMLSKASQPDRALRGEGVQRREGRPQGQASGRQQGGERRDGRPPGQPGERRDGRPQGQGGQPGERRDGRPQGQGGQPGERRDGRPQGQGGQPGERRDGRPQGQPGQPRPPRPPLPEGAARPPRPEGGSRPPLPEGAARPPRPESIFPNQHAEGDELGDDASDDLLNAGAAGSEEMAARRKRRRRRRGGGGGGGGGEGSAPAPSGGGEG